MQQAHSNAQFDPSINHGIAPVTYGQSDRPPRGDYSTAKEDYTCGQEWESYTTEAHALYAKLFARQIKQLPNHACEEFITAVAALGEEKEIPRFEEISEKLYRATRWEIVGVPGLVPEEAFFALLAQRKFPVTVWLRNPEEIDYIVEPDVFHDLFGHVPLLFNPIFADYIQAYGKGGLKATQLHACEYLARLYWYTVEFGLIQTQQGLRAYGAGILSSGSELRYSLKDKTPNRVAFDLERMMRSLFKIDTFQETYFVIDSYEQLFNATALDFAPIYERVKHQPELATNVVLPGEKTFAPNT